MSFKSIFLCTVLFLFIGSYTFADHAKPMKTSEFATKSESGTSYQLKIDSTPIKTMQAQPATLIVTDTNGEPISGIAISCSMKMPSMAMAKNTPPIKETDQTGIYQSIFLFTMGGDWSVNCIATDNNQATEVFTFEINDVPHGEMAKGKQDMNKMLGKKNHSNMKEM